VRRARGPRRQEAIGCGIRSGGSAGRLGRVTWSGISRPSKQCVIKKCNWDGQKLNWEKATI